MSVRKIFYLIDVDGKQLGRFRLNLAGYNSTALEKIGPRLSATGEEHAK